MNGEFACAGWSIIEEPQVSIAGLIQGVDMQFDEWIVWYLVVGITIGFWASYYTGLENAVKGTRTNAVWVVAWFWLVAFAWPVGVFMALLDAIGRATMNRNL